MLNTIKREIRKKENNSEDGIRLFVETIETPTGTLLNTLSLVEGKNYFIRSQFIRPEKIEEVRRNIDWDNLEKMESSEEEVAFDASEFLTKFQESKLTVFIRDKSVDITVEKIYADGRRDTIKNKIIENNNSLLFKSVDEFFNYESINIEKNPFLNIITERYNIIESRYNPLNVSTLSNIKSKINAWKDIIILIITDKFRNLYIDDNAINKDNFINNDIKIEVQKDNSNGDNFFMALSNKQKGSVTFTGASAPNDLAVTISNSLGEGVVRHLMTFTIVADGTSRTGLINIIGKCNGVIGIKFDDIDYYTVLNGLSYILNDKEVYGYNGTEGFNIKDFYIMELSSKKMIKLF